MKAKGIQNIIQVLIVLAILIVINVISSFFYTQFDLTEEKKYTLTQPTVDLINDLDEVIYVKVLLDGNLPAGFKRLRVATEEILKQFHSMNPNFEFEFDDPNAGTTEEINQRRESLYQDRIVPTKVDFYEGDEYVQKFIYPYALIYRGDRFSRVNLLESLSPGNSEEQTLNNSVSLLEYKLSDAIQKIIREKKRNVVFTSSHEELDSKETGKLRTILKRNYNIGSVHLDSLVKISSEIDLLMVIKPRTSFSDKDLFKIDQYLMNGGKVIWLIDVLKVDVNKINGALSVDNKFYLPEPYELGLNDMFFKYGIRIQPNLVLDLECSPIPQVTGMQGDKVQTSLFPYYYHPIVSSTSDHPIVKNIDRVNLFFPSTIDTIATRTNIRKTTLLQSSPYSRFQLSPVRLNFEILKYDPDVSKFNKGKQNIAVLTEGVFESYFKNRVQPGMRASLKEANMEFKEESVPTKQLFVSDADFVKNKYNPQNNKITEIGFNEWERKVYGGNEDFILNAVEYMMDENGVLASRAKEIKLRLLDRVQTKEDRGYWQFINLVLPLIILALFGVIFYYFRRKKYAS